MDKLTVYLTHRVHVLDYEDQTVDDHKELTTQVKRVFPDAFNIALKGEPINGTDWVDVVASFDIDAGHLRDEGGTRTIIKWLSDWISPEIENSFVIS